MSLLSSVSRGALVLSLALAAPVALHAEAATEAAPAAAPAAENLPTITVASVTKRELTDIVLASGLINAVEEVQVAPLIEGQQIEALLADVGDKVAEGQVLARLSSSTLELQRGQSVAQLEAARAAVAQAEAGLIEANASADEAERVNDRTKTLRKQGTASQAAADTALAGATSARARVMVATQSLASARANEALAQAQLANIDLQLARTEVKAPVAGEITARNARLGAIASAAGAPMFTLIRDGALELNADLAESDVLRVAAGQTATIRLAGTAEPLTGTVRLVEPAIDATTRLGRARIAIDQDGAVRPGMFAEATLTIASHFATAVPITAVGSADQKTTVMKVAADGTVSQVEITTGIRDDGWIEVTAGLSEGDVIVAKAGAFVRNGDRIRPVPGEAPTN